MEHKNESRQDVIKKFSTHEGDTGSAEVQIALLTSRIKGLATHFDLHKKDHSSRRGLLMMVGRRRKLLKYVKKHKQDQYKYLLKELGLRK